MRLKALLVVFLSLCAVSTYAQYKAGLQGTIVDKSGAAVAGGKLTLTGQETGVQRDATSNDSGVYRFTELPPGTFTLTVEAASFQKKEIKDITVNAEQARGVDVTLDLGEV